MLHNAAIQDAVVHREKYPKHPLYQMGLFGMPEWEQFAEALRIRRSAQRQALELAKAAADPARTLAALHTAIVDGFARLAVQMQPAQQPAPPPYPASALHRPLQPLGPVPPQQRVLPPDCQGYRLSPVLTVEDVLAQFVDFNGKKHQNSPSVLQAEKVWPNGKWQRVTSQGDVFRKRRYVYAWCVARTGCQSPLREQLSAAGRELQAFLEAEGLTLDVMARMIRAGEPILGVAVHGEEGPAKKKNKL
jgi:hypothetical protein